MWLVTAVKRGKLASYIAWLGVKSAYEYRAAFWLQVIGMIINNSAVMVVLVLFYAQFGNVHGWGFKDSLFVFGVNAIAFGGTQLLFGNMIGNNLGERIVDGNLDTYMLFPQDTLFHLSIRRIDISGLGDILSGLSYVLLSGYLNSWHALLLPIGVVAAMAVLYGGSLLVQSLTFWFAGLRSYGGVYTSTVTMTANWPRNAFTGLSKVVLLGVFPALFTVYLPAQLVTRFEWSALGLVVAFAVAINIAGRLVFARGLKRYESGNLVTTNL
ncbi:MAG TPA: ABC-2 family transporter protein [Candidatus Saccharimonadales bacterium]|nr:ABC-2 family transporter protein [Candidatus Saccharimonadales bacterium]